LRVMRPYEPDATLDKGWNCHERDFNRAALP
jgi:hypothetical protein